jgi:hypothetical protein
MLRATAVAELLPIEAFIMLLIIFAFLLSVFNTSRSPGWSILEILQQMNKIPALPAEFVKLRNAHNTFSDIGAMARNCLKTAIVTYNVWFWFKGVDELSHSVSCVPMSFLFVPISLNSGRVRSFYKAFAVIYLYYTSFPFKYIGKGLSMLLRSDIKRGWRKLLSVPWGAELGHQVKQKCSDLWGRYITMSVPHENLIKDRDSNE